MKDEMAFRFNHSNGQQLACSLKAEPVSIGCEAWIDVSRFLARKSSRQSIEVRTRGSLTKSFALLRRKLRPKA
ncbi:MAG: hypothetical protein OJF50_002773 [Nitrospira sp.]|nr:hypothetical protein [Nitrospira sp.]